MKDLQKKTAQLEQLTPRELEVLTLRGQGQTIKEIAEDLVVTERAVKFHLGNIYRKLDLQDLSSPATRAIEIQEYYQLLKQIQETETHISEEPPILEPEPEEPPQDALVVVLEDELELVKKGKTAIQPYVIPIPPPFDEQNIDEDVDFTNRRRRALLFFGLTLAAAVLVGGLLGAGVTVLFLRQDNDQIASASTETATPIPTTSPVPTVRPEIFSPDVPVLTMCGEVERLEPPFVDRFIRSQGVSAFTVSNTDGAVLNNKVRALALDERGLWIGYFPTEENPTGGIRFYDKQGWIHCGQPGEREALRVNAVKIDNEGRVWIGTERSGIMMFDGEEWHTFTTDNGLLDDGIFGLTLDPFGNMWAATWEGVAKFDGEEWTVPYSIYNNTLFNNHVHAVAFSRNGDIWVGHIRDAGVSYYSNDDGQWHHLTAETSGIGGNEVRDIVIREANEDRPESVWIATTDGGVSRFEQGNWTVYQVEDGLPSNHVNAVAIDKYARIWAATDRGVAYLENSEWILYNTLETWSIAFAPNCEECPFENGEHIWTGTADMGLAHSRLPFLNNEDAVQVLEVCFVPLTERERTCAVLDKSDDASVVTALHPEILRPGEKFRVEVFVSPRAPYQLKNGDFLANVDESDEKLFGAWRHMAVEEVVEPGEPFQFTDYDSPFVAPLLEEGETEQVHTSTWRVWMHTRYVGPYIRIAFEVQEAVTDATLPLKESSLIYDKGNDLQE